MKSSIHIVPVKSNSEKHNLRKEEIDYNRKDLMHENFNWGFEKTLAEIRIDQEKLYKEKVGQKMQKKATPLREGVFLISKENTNEQILNVVQGVEKKFGIKAVQLSVHRDEGHYNEHLEWKKNLHAHVVFDWQDKTTGKSFKLNREDLSRLQTYFSEGLGLERGKTSSKEHLNALEYKNKAALGNAYKTAKLIIELENRKEKTIPIQRAKVLAFKKLLNNESTREITKRAYEIAKEELKIENNQNRKRGISR